MAHSPKDVNIDRRVDVDTDRWYDAIYLDANLGAGLKAIKERDGVSEAEQIRRGIKLYLESKGLTLKPARKGGKRKR